MSRVQDSDAGFYISQQKSQCMLLLERRLQEIDQEAAKIHLLIQKRIPTDPQYRREWQIQTAFLNVQSIFVRLKTDLTRQIHTQMEHFDWEQRQALYLQLRGGDIDPEFNALLARINTVLLNASETIQLALAEAHVVIDSVFHDCIIFINFDQPKGSTPEGLGLGVGYRKKMEKYRGVGTTPIEIRRNGDFEVATYIMNEDPTKRYIQISVLDQQDFLNDAPEFQYLTPGSKIIAAGHGLFESISILTDAEAGCRIKSFGTGMFAGKGEDARPIPIKDLARFIVTNIKKHSPYKFTTLENPLKMSIFFCQAAGLISDYNIIQKEDKTLVSQYGRTPVSLANTMAGRLLHDLRQVDGECPVLAVIKARTTTVISVNVPTIAEPLSLSETASPYSLSGTYRCQNIYGVPATGALHGTPQFHRGQDIFDPSQLKKIEFEYYSLHKQAGFQGHDHRIHGYKRKFQWGPDGQMQVTDVSDNSAVDPFFEIQKDRVLQYLFYLASTGPQFSSSRSLFLNTLLKVERAKNIHEMAVLLDQDLTTAEMEFNKKTIVTKLHTHLTTKADILLPAPYWQGASLGL
ncbi:MAG: hypothetical protein A3J38_07925 [Gammaproteobacteria bacterium RIFCSPHIGHO2_12_FULL_45_9]|nr:MAG: hypothetical protein A3J38_07925 [Gammaproteobacteria bacterium RIFCSPHIGHO2_12_FULL_45_9]